MVQIVNITDARNNLAKLVEKVNTTKNPVVLIQDSRPAVVIYPYEDMVKKDAEKDELFQLRFQKVFQKGEQAFTKYLKDNKLPTPSTEEEAYTLIKNA